MLPKGKIIKINQACVNCKHAEEINKAQSDMVLYRCSLLVERNPIFLDEKACLLWLPVVANFALKLTIRKEYRLYVCIDEEENIWAHARNESNCLIKALNNIRLAFLIEKRQLNLFDRNEKDGDPPMMIKISEIKIGKRMRGLNEDKVKELMESIQKVGLIHPIVINKEKALLAGAHRLEAVKRLGFDGISAEIKDNLPLHGLDKGLYDTLIEIDENLLGPQLTALERADFLGERKRIYEILHPETKQGQAQVKAMTNKSDDNDVMAENAVTFTKDVAAKVGLSERTIREDVQLAKSLCAEARNIIVGTWLEDKKGHLFDIGKLCPDSQAKVAKRLIEFPALSLDWAIKRVEAERYGFHLTPTFLIDLQKSTLHLYNSGMPIENQKELVGGIINHRYPPFDIMDLILVSKEQDELVDQTKVELFSVNTKPVNKQEESEDVSESTARLMQKELIDFNITMPKRNDKKVVPVLVLPDGNKRILSHLADERFLSAPVNKEMLERVDMCLSDNDAILIRRIGNLLSVSKASINSERFIEEINKSFDQIK